MVGWAWGQAFCVFSPWAGSMTETQAVSFCAQHLCCEFRARAGTVCEIPHEPFWTPMVPGCHFS